MGELKKSLAAALWFAFLAFPLVGVRADFIEKTVSWRWLNLLWVALGAGILSYVWRLLLAQKNKPQAEWTYTQFAMPSIGAQALTHPWSLALMAMALLVMPMLTNQYQTSILITAMMYIVLGLGLNIVVGMAGLLDLGYVAFYATGAYVYGMLNLYWDWGFWAALPVAGLLAALLGTLLGIPVLRLRGDYLAIVTLGFGEIIRLVLENSENITHGPAGIANLPKPELLWTKLDFDQQNLYLYYLIFALMALAMLTNRRLQNSRMGRAWLALRENELAAQAMGIDLTKTKLAAFATGAFWAGIVGVFFAAKSSYINPASFSFHESAIILSIVVLGGMGSVLGVVLAAVLLILLPEYLRFLQEYRMVIFGVLMVLTMIFKPDGLVPNARPYYLKEPDESA